MAREGDYICAILGKHFSLFAQNSTGAWQASFKVRSINWRVLGETLEHLRGLGGLEWQLQLRPLQLC